MNWGGMGNEIVLSSRPDCLRVNRRVVRLGCSEGAQKEEWKMRIKVCLAVVFVAYMLRGWWLLWKEGKRFQQKRKNQNSTK